MADKVKEAKLKARKTSLSKKTNDELIEIILKKDNTERKNNSKIMALHTSVEDLKVIVEAKEKQINEQVNSINHLDEECDKLSHYNKNQQDTINSLDKKVKTLTKTIENNSKLVKSAKFYKGLSISFGIICVLETLFFLLTL